MKVIVEILPGGDKEYRLSDGRRHREDGPAYEAINGYRAWWFNGERHREDGPAMEYSNGLKYWYYHGQQIHCKSNEEFINKIESILVKSK